MRNKNLLLIIKILEEHKQITIKLKGVSINLEYDYNK